MSLQEKAMNSDEMDLIAFFAHFRRFLRMTAVPSILLGILGLLAGVLLARKPTPVYENKLIMQVGVLNKGEIQAFTDTWKNLIVAGELDQLSVLLHCPAEMLKYVSGLSASVIPSADTKKDGMPGLLITASVSDTNVLPALQKALVSGFEQNQYIARQVFEEQQHLNTLINRIVAEIRELDSLKKSIRSAGFSASYNSQNQISLSTINKDIVELSEKKTLHENALRKAVAVNVLQGFVQNPVQTQNRMKGIISFCVIGLVTGFLLGAFRFIRFRYPILFSSKPVSVSK